MGYHDDIAKLVEIFRGEKLPKKPPSPPNLSAEVSKIARRYGYSADDVMKQVELRAAGYITGAQLMSMLADEFENDTVANVPDESTYITELFEHLVISTGGHAYFVFVEDVNNFDGGKVREFDGGTPHWRNILHVRKELEMPEPRSLVWLDAVDARYFLSLPWRSERCEIGDEKASARRRELLQSMDSDSNMFRIIAAPMSRDSGFEASCLDNFAPSSWHWIVLDENEGTPVAVIPDYNIDDHPDEKLQYIRRAGAVSEHTYEDLNEVFSLNFIPDLVEDME